MAEADETQGLTAAPRHTPAPGAGLAILGSGFEQGPPLIAWCDPAFAQRTGLQAGATVDLTLSGVPEAAALRLVVDGAPLAARLTPLTGDGCGGLAILTLAPSAGAGDDDLLSRVRLALDALPNAFALFDGDERLGFANAPFLRLAAAIGLDARIGMRFETLLDEGLETGSFPDAAGREAAWREEALSAHRLPVASSPFAAPGDRHFRVLRRRTLRGDVALLLNDVTETVRHERTMAEDWRQSAYFSHMANVINDSVLIVDHRWCVEWANTTFLTRYNLRLEDILGRLPEEFMDLPHMHASPLNAIRTRALAGETVEVESWFTRPDGQRICIELQIRAVFDSAGNHLRTISVGRDITLRKEASSALHAAKARAEAAERRMLAAIEAVPNPFVIYDDHEQLVTFNESYRSFYPETGGALRPGMTFEQIIDAALAHEEIHEAFGREAEWRVERLSAFRNPIGVIEQRLAGDRYLKLIERRTSHGDTVAFSVDVTDIRRQQRHLERYAELLSQANTRIAEKNHELLRSQQAVKHAALHDALTGLANRRYLDIILQETTAAETTKGLALLHIDLDRFKQINDTMGHGAGDAVLRAVARVLRQTTRAGDFVARVGGDEFVVLCRHALEREELALLATRIVEALREPVEHEGSSCRFGGSIGIAVAPPGQVNAHEVLVNADLALYRAKNSGRNRFEFFSESLQVEIKRRKNLADAMVVGIDRGEFVPFYQPQFDLATLDVVGVEALARWQSPGGLLLPGAFLDIARDLSLDATLDRRILEASLADLRRWQADGTRIPRLSVNVSARRLYDPDLIAHLRALDIPQGALVFELLESTYLDAPEGVAAWNLDGHGGSAGRSPPHPGSPE